MSKISPNAVFTLRDLNRQPAKVLEAVRKFGSAEVRTRGGEVFTVALKPDEKPQLRVKVFPNFETRWKKLREAGNAPPPLAEIERINRIIASEE